MTTVLRTTFLAAAMSLAAIPACLAEDLPEIAITLKNHTFTPAEVHVPAGKAVVLVVTNQDDQSDEFEMHHPAVEKVIAPGATVKIRMRPLGAGSYPFVAEFHEATAKGVIVSQ